jgi:tRNA nucleotidyltransferase (CCA-adding enzyme)
MTNHEYLKSILDEEKIDHTVEETKTTRKEVKDFLVDYYKKEKTVDHIYAGSIAKGTAIKSKYDIDIGISFNNEDFRTLKEMFDDVKMTLEKEYGKSNTREQNVSIRIEKNGHDIDVVPCRKIKNDDTKVNLYLNRKDNNSLQSNLHIHVDEIKDFSELETIKLLKIWKIRKEIKFKSFGLELMVKKAFEKQNIIGLDNKFKYMMKYIVDNIDDIVLLDPSNTNNNIAETIKEAHKDKMKKYAKRALKCIENDSWKNIFDASRGQCLDKENSDVLKSAFTGIAAKPYAKVS